MSELTTEQVLQVIQEARERGEPVDLRHQFLIGVDLSRDTVHLMRDRFSVAITSPEGRVDLIESHFEGNSLEYAHLQGALLTRAYLEGVWLQSAHLEGATLFQAHLEHAELWLAHLEGALLREAHLEGADLVDAHLEGADLSGSALRGAHFCGAYLDRTRFTRAELGRRVEKEGQEEVIVPDTPFIGEEAEGEWSEAKEAYLALKQNFQSLGYYEDKSWAYVKERQMERKGFFPSEAGDTWLAEAISKRPGWLKPFLGVLRWLRLLLWPRAPQGVTLDRPKWLRNLFWEWVALYGESIWRPAFWGVAIITLWSLLLSWVGVDGAQNGTDYLVFSLRSFATMAFNDLQPGNLAAKLLSVVEAMLGVSTLALVMYCLGRRMSGS